MKYYTDTYSGIDNIFDEIFKNNKKIGNLKEADFAYIQKFRNIDSNDFKDVKHFNNFIDPHNQICRTGNYCLGNKSTFYDYFLKYYKKKPKYLPNTYAFNSNNIEPIRDKFIKDNIWILKPTNSFARDGITVVNSYKLTLEWIKKNRKFNQWILQEYIRSPLLYKGKKFHIRFYCLCVKYTNKFKAYRYKNGFFYLASEKYSKNDLSLSKHLTGAKYCYVHQVYPDLEKYMEKNKFKSMLEQSEKIMVDTLSICEKILDCPNKIDTNKGNCFHLFAFDLLMDTSGKLHLLEVNNGTVGMETIDYRPDLCINKPSKKLHNINIIKNLHHDLVKIVINNDLQNTGFKEVKLNNLNVIEEFLGENSSTKNYDGILILFLLILLYLLI
jgi:hypothetical protein